MPSTLSRALHPCGKYAQIQPNESKHADSQRARRTCGTLCAQYELRLFDTVDDEYTQGTPYSISGVPSFVLSGYYLIEGTVLE